MPHFITTHSINNPNYIKMQQNKNQQLDAKFRKFIKVLIMRQIRNFGFMPNGQEPIREDWSRCSIRSTKATGCFSKRFRTSSGRRAKIRSPSAKSGSAGMRAICGICSRSSANRAKTICFICCTTSRGNKWSRKPSRKCMPTWLFRTQPRKPPTTAVLKIRIPSPGPPESNPRQSCARHLWFQASR